MNTIFRSWPFAKVVLNVPILSGLIILLGALFFRVIDIFLLRLDERLGEIILSKSLAFILVVFLVRSMGYRLKSIGLHSLFIKESIFIGLLITTIALTVGYIAEFIILSQSGAHPALFLGPIDPKAGITGGTMFGLWLLMGNFVNSFMEEGLFRGLLIPLFGRKMSLMRAIWLQALLFGAWHLVWVLKGYQTGQYATTGELLFGLLANSFPQIVLGVVWGYMYLKTNSLWAPWISHTLTNSTLNFLHINADTGIDNGIVIRMSLYMLIMLLSLLLVKFLSDRFKIPNLKPW